MPESLRVRLPHLILVVISIIGLGPTATPRPLVETIRAANIALAADRPDAAIDLLEEAMSYEPALVKLHSQAAIIALAAGDDERSLAHIDSATAADPLNPTMACIRIRALMALGDTSKAAEIWDSLQESCDDSDQFLNDLVQVYLFEGDLASAESALDDLAQIRATDPDIHLSLAIIIAIRQPENALDDLRFANELSPDGIPLASALIRAIEDARPSQNPAYSLAQVGQTLATHGVWESAVWAFQQALDYEPQYTEARAYLGLALDNSGGDGLSELESAVAESPSTALPHIFLARHWQGLGEHDRARLEFEIAARLDPTNPAIAADLGAVFSDLGDVKTAEEAFRHATNLAPKDPRFWLLLAQFSLSNEIEIRSLGLPAVRNALILDPQNPVSLESLGYANLLLGNLHLADRLLWQAIDRDPLRATSQYHLGLLRQIQGDPIRAIAAWRLATQLDPSGPVGELAELALERFLP